MIRVLVVEDEPVAAQAHRVYLGRVPGFEVAEVVHSGAGALTALRADGEIDLVLLDFNLPDLHGLEVCRAMRAAGVRADVIAVTSARDLPTVRSAVSVGIRPVPPEAVHVRVVPGQARALRGLPFVPGG